jgi:hypothetical protein
MGENIYITLFLNLIETYLIIIGRPLTSIFLICLILHSKLSCALSIAADNSTKILRVNSDQLTIRNSSAAPFVTYGSPIEWKATATGTVLITWHKIAPFVLSCNGGHLGFQFLVNNERGAFSTMNFITNINRFAVGDMVYAPIYDMFTIVHGGIYSITMHYFAQSFSSCLVNTRGNSAGFEIFKIEYVK